LAHLDTALQAAPSYTGALRWKIACLAHLGRMAEAKEALACHDQYVPGYTITDLRQSLLIPAKQHQAGTRPAFGTDAQRMKTRIGAEFLEALQTTRGMARKHKDKAGIDEGIRIKRHIAHYSGNFGMSFGHISGSDVLGISHCNFPSRSLAHILDTGNGHWNQRRKLLHDVCETERRSCRSYAEKQLMGRR
jgi:hypothetical protein